MSIAFDSWSNDLTISSFMGDNSSMAASGGEPGLKTPDLQAREWGQRWAVIAAASALSLLYLGFVYHYSTNAPLGDDWSTITVVHAALSGHLGFGMLAAQHLEARPFVPNLIFVAAGWADHLDFRSITVLSALLLIAGYALLLLLFRAYQMRPLTVPATLLLGIVWLSIGDVGNALWGFQLAWYISLLMFVVICYLMTVPSWPSWLTLGLSIVAAGAASFSMVQGLLLWPIGVLLIIWFTPWSRRTFAELASWLGAAVVIITTFLLGYNFSEGEFFCAAGQRCTLGLALKQPGNDLSYIFRLAGEVAPTQTHASFFQAVVGVALLAGSAFVIVQALRERRQSLRNPLPLVLVSFALLFDASITLGRVGQNTPWTPQYVMPQLVMLTGIVVYAYEHATRHDLLKAIHPTTFIYIGLGLLLVVQFSVSSAYGYNQGRTLRSNAILSGRLLANLSKVPKNQLSCDEDAFLQGGIVSPNVVQRVMNPLIAAAKDSELSVFDPATYRYFRSIGPPPPYCAHFVGGTKSPGTPLTK